ncbi:helix-turn-helix domain-containing protein [Limnoglobus roseus]|uniref:XRE family transcriptional regulator n=1 Tax=Limnoglobus roseus TaxID=2598579 RepID=A0A5C1AKS0_9BACT|nr:helix-turn-helix transcriptional regulator [Limnoglobus roseus]QEL19811.1 XRE family transcriptional regulator [Limnoglobus roseus]
MAKDAKKRALELLSSGHELLEQVGKVLTKAEVLIGSVEEGAAVSRRLRLESEIASFAEWVRTKMLHEDLTEKDLASRSGIAFGTLHSYLNTSKLPTLVNAVRLVVALNADFNELFRVRDLVAALADVKNLPDWMDARFETT